jgi:uncharacterized MAPEG superfamily protein
MLLLFNTIQSFVPFNCAGAARSSSEGEKAVQEWQRAMKSPSPSKWRANNAVRQLEADTIALAAGAVTAMLAANAAAAGPLDSPEKVGHCFC